MEKENNGLRKTPTDAGGEKKTPAYWESWIRNGGDKRQVAKEMGVTLETVHYQVNRAVKENGFSSVAEAKIHFGFRKASSDVNAGQLMNLLKAQGFKCALTGEQLTPENCELDHIIPMSKGGGNNVENLQWVLRTINRAKGVMTQEEFVSMCQDVVRWVAGSSGSR